jgi:endonuclease-3
VVPEAFRQHAHHWLILHGRYVCTARVPGCPECPLVDLCEYREKTPPPGEGRRIVARGAKRARRARPRRGK